MVGDWEHSAIPRSERQPLYKVLAVWVNFIFVPVFIGFAFGLSRSMSFSGLLAAILVGAAILAFCSIISGLIGQRTGLSAGLLVTHVFGSAAGRLIALLVPLLLIGWNSFSLDLVGTEIVNNFGHPELRWLYILVPTILFASTATVGFRVLAPMSLISIPIMAGLMLYGLSLAASEGMPTAFPVGAATPFSTAVTQTVGLFALGSILCSPDIQRFCKTSADAIVVGFVTFIIALPFLLIVGGLLALHTETPSMLTAFAKLNLLWVGLFAFLLLSWSCCDNDYYSAGLGVAAVTGLKKSWLVPPIAAIAATVAIFGIGRFLEPWLILMTTIALPVAGVFIADFLLLHRRIDPASPVGSVRVSALVSWAFGAAVAYLTTQAQVGIPPIQGMLTACLVQYVLSTLPLARIATQ